MTARRVFALSTLLALLSPFLMVGVVALHLALEHDHEWPAGRVAGGLAVAEHGHHHPPGTAAHRHDAVPTQGHSWGPAARQGLTAIVPVVALAADRRASMEKAADQRSPPPLPTISPPVLRV